MRKKAKNNLPLLKNKTKQNKPQQPKRPHSGKQKKENEQKPNQNKNQGGGDGSLIPALGRPRQVDVCEFKAHYKVYRVPRKPELHRENKTKKENISL